MWRGCSGCDGLGCVIIGEQVPPTRHLREKEYATNPLDLVPAGCDAIDDVRPGDAVSGDELGPRADVVDTTHLRLGDFADIREFPILKEHQIV